MSFHRTLEVTIISAKDLHNANFFSSLQAYAVATISGDPSTRQRTPTDREGHCNPTWNATFRFPIPASADASGLTLVVLLRAERVLGDRDVGEVNVPIADLVTGTQARQFVSYQVTMPCGTGKGVLNFSYIFKDDVATSPIAASYPPENVVEEPMMEYAAYPYPYAHPPPPVYPVYNQAPPVYPVYNQAPAGYPVYNQAPVGYPVYDQAPGGYPAYSQAPAGFPVYDQAPGGYPAYNQAPAGFPVYNPVPAGYPAYFQATRGYGCAYGL